MAGGDARVMEHHCSAEKITSVPAECFGFAAARG
jgi:hypothetical protein